MALVLQLLPLLLSRAQGDAQVSLDGRPGDLVNLSCSGISHPIRWAWAPSFPTCKGLSKGRRPILWASSSGTPTVSPVHPFAGRLRVLDPGIRRLELLLSAGDSGTFICRGRHEEESRTVLKVMGDGADCRTPGPSQAPLVKAEPQKPVKEEEPQIAGDMDQEQNLLYADLDHMAFRRPRQLLPVVPADSSTIYAVVV
ncbi:megakaryocyte and platelet inhibitory receptor G6b isoform X3 [Phyllostomus hastatus]|uniref:megakaryocyte and platelet inhibitory receptor G6b isoform X3 n=1 Tax=Phyllostomus hastatus TaxID=9423 RepID=UPI001E67E94A|nr:megakaryocyte and platelet inhibitory receptor G6b isoform X3 [Phyllostomus hastatus]